MSSMDDSDDEEEAMDIDSGSDDDGGEGASSSNPYPLEGLYKNEADRSRSASDHLPCRLDNAR